MVERFVLRHFCGGFLDGKMTARLEICFLLGGPLVVLEVYDNERGVLRKECGLEMSRETYLEVQQGYKEWW